MIRRRFLPTRLALAFSLPLAAAAAVNAPLEPARELADQVPPTIMAAIWPAHTPRAPAVVERESLGAILAKYAAHPAGDPQICESFTEAARRILAGGPATKRTPDETIAALDDLADAILAGISTAQKNGGVFAGSELGALQSRAYLARFHARRTVAAMHYNLFLRGLRLAELVAATYAEKEAVAAWRTLLTFRAPPEIAAARRAELPQLERSLKELEEQCCPPDEAILREKVWQPVRPPANSGVFAK